VCAQNVFLGFAELPVVTIPALNHGLATAATVHVRIPLRAEATRAMHRLDAVDVVLVQASLVKHRQLRLRRICRLASHSINARGGSPDKKKVSCISRHGCC
jgi:hypothetical protein